jgi:glycosyltransferase involved in cell wall biosynthesis
MIKTAIVAPYPASVVLPEESIKNRAREKAKVQHPAPWVAAICKELNALNGIEVEVFTHSRYVSSITRTIREGVKYTFIPKYEPAKIDPYNLYLPALFQFLPVIRRYNPNIVHGFGTEGAYGLLAVCQKKPSIVFIQGIVEKLSPFSNRPKPNLIIRKLIERFVINNANGIIAETEFAKNWALKIRPTANIRLIPHAYTDIFFNVSPIFESRRLLCIGSLSRIKGCMKVLDAFSEGMKRNSRIFKKSKLVFIGDGPLMKELRSTVELYKLSEYVEFKGNIAHNTIPAEMQKACMLVLGSRMDTSPNVITEAHTAGLPVIATETGGIPNMIKDGIDGFIVPVDHVELMSLRMEMLLYDLVRCAKMGASGRKKIKKLNNPFIIAKKHKKFYKEILSNYK